MSNGEVCCILGVCCPVPAQLRVIERHLVRIGVPIDYAQTAAQWFQEELDRVAAGGPLGAAITALEQAHPGGRGQSDEQEA